jgi:hypothetical protein
MGVYNYTSSLKVETFSIFSSLIIIVSTGGALLRFRIMVLVFFVFMERRLLPLQVEMSLAAACNVEVLLAVISQYAVLSSAYFITLADSAGMSSKIYSIAQDPEGFLAALRCSQVAH